MITRPLDLASKLRPEPRNFGALFYVNMGLLGLFFTLFGSRFVLAPGLGVDFRLPTVTGATANARPPTHVITVTNSGQIFTGAGLRKMDELPAWLREQAKGVESPTLLVRGESLVPNAVVAEISGAAKLAGFESVIWAAEEMPVAQKRRG